MPATAHPLLRAFLLLFPTGLQIAIVVVMLYRGLHRTLPIFFSYLIYEVARNALVFLIRENRWLYFYCYLVTEFVGCMWALCVFKELFDKAFSRYLGLHRVGNFLFKGSVLLLVVIAVLWAWKSPATDIYRIIAALVLVKRTITFVQAGLLASLFLTSLGLGLSWSHQVRGVALGFGVYGAVDLAVLTARSVYGHAAATAANWIMMVVNACCVLIWASYFLRPAKEPAITAVEPRYARLFQEWNEAVGVLAKGANRNS